MDNSSAGRADLGAPSSPDKKKLLDVSFDVALLLKGLFAAGEILCGVAAFFLSPKRVIALVATVSRDTPATGLIDRLVDALYVWSRSFSAGTQHFVIIYLLFHGIVKLAVIILLWKKQLWAYPVSVIVFTGFIVYQLVQFASTHSILLLLLTALDVIVIILTILEYRTMMKSRRLPAPQQGQ